MDYAGDQSVGLALSSDLYGNQFDIKGWCGRLWRLSAVLIDDEAESLFTEVRLRK